MLSSLLGCLKHKRTGLNELVVGRQTRKQNYQDNTPLNRYLRTCFNTIRTPLILRLNLPPAELTNLDMDTKKPTSLQTEGTKNFSKFVKLRVYSSKPVPHEGLCNLQE